MKSSGAAHSFNYVRFVARSSFLLSDFVNCRRSIAAGRMYRSLFEHAFSTEYMYVHDVPRSFLELLIN
jgi:hypothetical protein